MFSQIGSLYYLNMMTITLIKGGIGKGLFKSCNLISNFVKIGKHTLHKIWTQKMKFSIRISSVIVWPNPHETADLVTFTEEILNRKLHFLCSGSRFESHVILTWSYPSI